MNSKPAEAATYGWAAAVWKGAAKGGDRGFSLIELLGVLAIITILAALLVPTIIRRVDIGAVKGEVASLDSISNSIILQVLRSNSIPSEGAWSQAAANWLTYAPANLTTNARKHARAFLVDTDGWLGANLPATGYYQQSILGTTMTNSARLMIVSSLTADLPVSSGRPSTSSFTDIWNTPPNTIPSTWTGWKGRPDDLLIERINLQPLFNRLILVSRDTNNAAAYVVAGQTNLVLAGASSNAYYIKGSVVGLASTNSGGTNLQTSYVLNTNTSFVFENGYWRTQIGNGAGFTNVGASLAALFNNVASNFIRQPVPYIIGNANKCADQQQVLAAMVDFMLIYQLWSFNPHGSFTTYNIGTGTSYDAIYSYLQDAAVTLDKASTGDQRHPGDLSGLLQ